MTTEILVKIYTDGSGDYTSLKAGWDANAQDLVANDSFIVFELKGDLRNTDPYIDANGYTTDATRKIIISPILGDETTGIANATGTVYGTNTYLLVGRNQFVDIDGLEIAGFSSPFHSASNINAKNCLIHSGSSAIGDPKVSNTIIYDCAINTLSNTNCDRVTAVNPGSVIYRNAGGVITASVGYGRDGGGTTYYNTTNAGNNNNASNDGTAPGATTYAIGQSDFIDYANKNYNISPSSSLYANNIGADLTPASGSVTSLTKSFSAQFNLNQRKSNSFTAAVALLARVNKNYQGVMSFLSANQVNKAFSFELDLLQQQQNQVQLVADLLSRDSSAFSGQLDLLQSFTKSHSSQCNLLARNALTHSGVVNFLGHDQLNFSAVLSLLNRQSKSFSGELDFYQQVNKSFTYQFDSLATGSASKSFSFELDFIGRLTKQYNSEITLLQRQGLSHQLSLDLLDRVAKDFSAQVDLHNTQSKNFTVTLDTIGRVGKTFDVVFNIQSDDTPKTPAHYVISVEHIIEFIDPPIQTIEFIDNPIQILIV
jgi:hypothetical protein